MAAQHLEKLILQFHCHSQKNCHCCVLCRINTTK